MKNFSEKFEFIFMGILAFMVFVLCCIPAYAIMAENGAFTDIAVLLAIPAVALGALLWAHLAD